MLYDKDCRDIPSCAEGEGKKRQAEQLLSIIQSTAVRCAVFRCCQQSRQTPVNLLFEASPMELREELPGERDGEGKQLQKTERCIVSKIGNPS